MMRRALALAAIIIVADQASKWAILRLVMGFGPDQALPAFSAQVVELTPFFNLVMTWNRGVSFGLFNNGGQWNALLLSVLSVGIVIGLLIWLRTVTSRWVGFALGGIIGGALGNVIDRVRWGAVADFLDLHLMGHHWPAFNVADSAISIGAVILVLDALFARSSSSKT